MPETADDRFCPKCHAPKIFWGEEHHCLYAQCDDDTRLALTNPRAMEALQKVLTQWVEHQAHGSQLPSL